MFNGKELVMKKKIRNYGLVAASLLAVGLSACADSQSSGPIYTDISDPFEGANRAVFAFNNVVDDAIIHPVVKGYNIIVPKPARTGLDNVLKNLKSPVILINQTLQGDFDGAGDVIVRTVVNTLLGVGGIFDIAGHEGLKYEPEDFGQTLAVWGLDHGPYLVVPIIGPSSTRDYIGYFVDAFADPLRWYLYNIDEKGWYYGKVAVDYFNLRASLVDVLEDLERSSIDYYAATRSAYYQSRDAMVQDLDPNYAVAPDIPDYDDL